MGFPLTKVRNLRERGRAFSFHEGGRTEYRKSERTKECGYGGIKEEGTQ